MSVRNVLVLSFLGSLAPLSAGASDVACAGKLIDTNWFVGSMNQADDAIALMRLDDARAMLEGVYGLLPCTQEPIHPNYLVRYARLRAIASFFDQDEFDMAYWGRLAETRSRVPWPEAFAGDHPVRDAFQFVDAGDVVRISGKQLLPPRGGAVLLDGEIILSPKAMVETPHFLQVLDSKGLVVSSQWVDGVAFPPEVMEDGEDNLVTPKWYEVPDAGLDPGKRLMLSDAEVNQREKAIRKAEENAFYDERRREHLLALEEKRASRRQAKLEKKRLREGEPPDLVVEAAEPDRQRKFDAPDEWVGFDFGSEKGLGGGSQRLTEVGCADLVTLEPTALMGRLEEDQIRCLEQSLRLEERQTRKDKVSRVLMADAFAKEEIHRWEGAVRRHLEEIDRSDADLCYIFARHLALKGSEFLPQAIRYANLALQNSLQWEGNLRKTRMYQLHRINAIGAQQLWYELEEKVVTNPSKELRQRSGFWRNQTKNLAREWLSWSLVAGLDPAAPFELCVQAAGTQQYCEAASHAESTASQ